MAKLGGLAVEGLFNQAWELTKKNAWVLVEWGGVLLLSQLILMIWASFFGSSWMYWFIQVTAILIHAFFQVALTRAFLRMVRGKKVGFGDMFWFEPKALGAYLVASVFYVIAVLAGLVAFVVPGVMLALLYSQYLCVIVDQKTAAVAALEKSVRLTRSQIGFLLEYMGWALLLLVFGVLALGVGLVVVVPVVVVSAFLVYEALRNASGR